ncbi:MAG: hypothetical protein MUC68_14105 [Burkholderiaceae bacterium]|jgi:flagellar biosynthesis/type III secretory pathway chaperone|nr:hypothetical protein [Burkholderiaceae bacterium]
MSRRAAHATSALLDDLLGSLRAEQQALVRGEAEALPALAAAKSQALDHLSAALRGSPASERQALAAALATAQRVNDTNAALIASRMSVNRARLDALLSLAGHAPAAAVYGSGGALAAPAASVRSAASA